MNKLLLSLIGSLLILTSGCSTSTQFSQNSRVASASALRECSTHKHKTRATREHCENYKVDFPHSSPGYAAVKRAALKHNVDVQFALLIAKIESRGRCNARSKKGAMGVMQVMPRTAKRHGVDARALLDCHHGATAGVLELKRLLQITKGNRKLAMIGYNCGEGCLRRSRLPKETIKFLKHHK